MFLNFFDLCWSYKSAIRNSIFVLVVSVIMLRACGTKIMQKIFYRTKYEALTEHPVNFFDLEAMEASGNRIKFAELKAKLYLIIVIVSK